jgi:polysaccharide deacetylase family protein (PEP-CTERM system associated)
LLNALSFDLEEWYHPEAIRKSNLRFERFSQVVEATTPLLNLLRQYQVKATFFTVGEVAEAHPHLIEHILNDGHELGFHGWSHDPLWALTPKSFTVEIERFLNWQQQTFPGVRSPGYRAPTFSLDQTTAWAVRILYEHGFAYDASVFPARTWLYGTPEAPLYPYTMSFDNPAEVMENGLLEIPMSIFPVGNLRIGFTGGLYLRALPFAIVKKLIQHTNNIGRAAVLYIHPWETYSHTPRLNLSPGGRFVLYHGLPSFEKLEKLLQVFQFSTMQDVFLHSAQLKIYGKLF